MNLTLDEQERAAYIAGDVNIANLMAELVDIKAKNDDLEVERDELEETNSHLSKELLEFRR